jgi:myosin heavy subunit
VSRQNQGERNFHVFYQLLEGLPLADKSRLGLKDVKDYYYLAQTGVTSIPGVNDGEEFKAFAAALGVIGLDVCG